MLNPYNTSRFNILPDGSVWIKDTVVTFGGDDIRKAVNGCNVLDVTVGAAGIETTTFIPGTSSGSLFVRNRLSTRTVKINVEMPLDAAAYAENLRAVRAWAYSTEPKDLCLSCYPGKKLSCTCTSISEFSPKTWWGAMEIVFTAWDPRFVDIVEKSALVGDYFTVKGDDEPLSSLKHTVSEPITGAKWSFDNSTYIKLLDSKIISSGTVSIDYNNKIVTHDGQSIMSSVALPSRFPAIQPGREHIIAGPSGGVFSWFERWL